MVLNSASKFVEDSGWAAGNTSLALTNLNVVSKGACTAYGLALAGACAVDAYTSPSLPAKCLFGIGGVCGFAGAISSGISIFNNTLQIPAFGVALGSVSTAAFQTAKRVNQAARVANGNV